MSGLKHHILLFILACLISGGISASGRVDEHTKPDIKILYIPGVADPFYKSMEEGAQQKAEAMGISLTVSDYPETWDPAIQIPLLNEAVAAGDYDLIMIAPVDRDALVYPLKVLYENGIQIITVDTEIGDGDYKSSSEWSFPLCHIGTDNFAGAVALGEDLAEKVGEKGKVYINTTTALTSTTEERKDGFIEGISHFPEMEVVRVDYNGDLQEVARNQTLSVLMDHPEIVAVFGTNVFSSQGVSSAVKNTGLSGAVRVAAWDSTETLIRSLRRGEVDLVLAQKPAEIGALAIEWAHSYLIENRTIPKSITSGYVILDKTNINDPDMEQYIY
ncbi:MULTISPECIES: ABC transporter substrate-binding protein [unclassified Oceanispirochaeta]|uniref:ABC transporter substrate-binding protein n=1 Tax=unclassified Oceanispirochaeta TaxID=2635722 RepID=UPI000E09AADD|nr:MULTISPECIES: ABC transporter substrate-binding protein [unclassified Oceanispirochaeta]MBF9016650.1 substrate-binding domain-containing protein [Oceanispirochaeta sp. M2]NPD73145.1 substrate-binding domain-containing protein [Oceanispirochaeta sp. M1]RDG31245.1 hypothetical protein DV872_13655 [Oceanispirochaeta sp. M1]